ncbi:GGDEF domain-containing response regulator [Alkalicoccus luteus]|uniref:Response regulator n=1 Tax=Alkalicoccus luteus TaxID=1237094 RepID=A0A969TVC4_9BACI|nr:response regulator [Alkalicoccus luteus]NJP38260.1 response regulator [Alkalicoccus luteus]
MEKYQKMVYDRIEKTLELWEQSGEIREEELYRFFHNVKGTAGTVGMTDVYETASSRLEDLSETGQTVLLRASWKPMIEELMPSREKPVLKDPEPASEEEAPFILVIDDDVEFIAYVKEMLETNGYQALLAMTGEKGVEMFYEFRPKLVILDASMPKIDGESVFSHIREKAVSDFTPVVLLGSETGLNERISAYEQGAMDFISKPLYQELFFPFLKNRLQLQERIWSSSLQDELTGAKNRKRLFQDMSVLQEKNASFSLVLCDLDFFKKINDTYGHSTGDEALRLFVNETEALLGAGENLYRYGGEEFIVIMEDAGPEQAEYRMEQLRERLKERPLENGVKLGFSAGVAVPEKESFHPEGLLEKADQALYYAKRHGRARTVHYREGLADAVEQGVVHIIVVDDDEIVRDMLRQYMQRRPELAGKVVRFRSYPDGAAFIEDSWYRENDYYFLLLDGMMPKLDGIDVLTEVRNTYPKDRILVSMLTARKSEAEIARALELGADDYMVKPFRVREVAARMTRLMERVFA